jgi:hypothetical protein
MYIVHIQSELEEFYWLISLYCVLLINEVASQLLYVILHIIYTVDPAGLDIFCFVL